jgi:hypothetical protein
MRIGKNGSGEKGRRRRRFSSFSFLFVFRALRKINPKAFFQMEGGTPQSCVTPLKIVLVLVLRSLSLSLSWKLPERENEKEKEKENENDGGRVGITSCCTQPIRV